MIVLNKVSYYINENMSYVNSQYNNEGQNL